MEPEYREYKRPPPVRPLFQKEEPFVVEIIKPDKFFEWASEKEVIETKPETKPEPKPEPETETKS